MSLHFPCPKCANEIATVDEALGKAVRCSRCQTHVAVPPNAQRRSPKPATPHSQNAPTADDLRVNCACGKSIRIPAHLAGRQGACPKCKTVFTIPSPTIAVEFLDDPAILPEIQTASLWGDEALQPMDNAQGLFDQPPVMSPSWNQPQAMATNTSRGGQPLQGSPLYLQPQYASRPKSNEPSNVLPNLTRACGIALVVFAVINCLFHVITTIPKLLQPAQEMERAFQARGLSINAEAVYMLVTVSQIDL